MKHNRNVGLLIEMMGQPTSYDQPFMRYENQAFLAKKWLFLQKRLLSSLITGHSRN